MPESFSNRFARVRAEHGPLVWGLDPSKELLERWGLGDNPDGLERFIDSVLEAAVGSVGLVKPQSAFFERQGWRGIRALDRLISEGRDAGLLVILDAKRGDVGSTNDAYAEAYLGEGAPLEVDAITVHPYLGLKAMATLISRAAAAGSCLLVVTRSSNPEGRQVQSASTANGQTVVADLLSDIGVLNADLLPDGIGPIGAVIGPTNLDLALDLVSPNCLFLAPGVGAQGATPADVEKAFASCPERVMPSASRSLLQAPDVRRLREDARSLAAEFRDLL